MEAYPIEKKEKTQLSKSQIDSAKITRTYAKTNKELDIRQTNSKENATYSNTQSMDNQFNLKVLQWNCRDLRCKVYELEKFANEWDIIILVETILKSNQPSFHISGFETVRFDRLSSNGGSVAFLVKKDLEFNTIELDFNLEVLEVRSITVSTSRGNIVLITCYRSPTGNNNIYAYEWLTFLDAIKKTGDEFLIGGDLNAHHTSWGSNHNCHNGNIIYNYTDPEHFIFLNSGSFTHISGP